MASTSHPCKSCASSNLVEINSEICLHSRGPSELNTAPIFLSPTFVLCLDCGLAQVKLSADDVQRIKQSRQRPSSA